MTLFYLAVAYIAGIAAGRLAWEAGWLGCETGGWWWGIPLALLPLTPLADRLHRAPAPPPLRWPVSAGFEPPQPLFPPGLRAAMLLCMLAGALRYASVPLDPCPVAAGLLAWHGAREPVTVTGYVANYPAVSEGRQRIRLAVEQITVAGTSYPVAGLVQLTTGAVPRYRFGEPLEATGRLVSPPDSPEFSYRAYLARQGVYSLLQRAQITEIAGPWQGAAWRRALYDVRSRGEELLNRLLAEPYAALANGMLLGIGDVIPDELYADFQTTNTSHVIVISGSNMVLLASLLLALSRRLLGMPLAIWPALAGIAAYTLLVGAEAPVVRAAIMSILVIIAAALKRRSTGMVSLAVAGWLMALADPRVLWDVGFQLSMAATLGLLLFTPVISAGLAARWPKVFGVLASGRARAGSFAALVRGLLLDGLVVTLAANVLVLPLGLYHFERFSPVFLLANLLILPVQPLILSWGLLALGLGLAGLALPAQAAAWIAWLGLAWTVAVVRWAAALPWANVAVQGYGLGWLAATYALIFAVYRRNQVIQAIRQAMQAGAARLVQPAALGLGTAVALLVWLAVWSLPDGRLHLYFLDVGQGDAIFLQTPSGRQVLIDGGRDPALLLSELGAVMPFWDRSLDLVVLTHPDADHMDGQVELPRRMAVAQALESTASQANPDGELWRAALRAAGVPVQVAQAGAWADLGDGVALWALWPPGDGGDRLGDNEASLVLKVVYGDFSALLTGDAGLASEAVWLAEGAPIQATVLKLGHHGSNTSSGESFLDAVNPQVAVIQVGAGNAYGHPHPEVLEALAGRQVLRTDLHGRVHIWSDGHRMWVETER